MTVVRALGKAFTLLIFIGLLQVCVITFGPGSSPPTGGLNPEVPADAVANYRRQFHFDEPLLQQAWHVMSDLFTGRLMSATDGRPALAKIAERAPATLRLQGTALLFVLGFGIPWGFFAARFAGRFLGALSNTLAFVLVALPGFWVAWLAMTATVKYLDVPVLGMESEGVVFQSWGQARLDWLWHVLLPAMVLAVGGVGVLSQVIRTTLPGILREDYVQTARAKGLRAGAVLYRHAFRNALRPLLVSLRVIVPSMLGASVIIESIFWYPGIGSLAWDAVQSRDYPLLVALNFILAILVLAVVFLSDLVFVAVMPHRPEPPQSGSGYRSATSRSLRSVAGVASVALVVTVVGVAARICVPADPNQTDLPAEFMEPSSEHWLGTDGRGRDVLARLLRGSRVALGVAAIAVTVSLAIGVVIGAAARLFGGMAATLSTQLADALMCFPSFLLILLLSALAGPGVWKTALVIGAVSWIDAARRTRTGFVSARASGHVTAAKVMGRRGTAIFRRHVLPAIWAPILLAGVPAVPAAILAECALGFLGLGVPDGSWGSMIAEAKPQLLDAWWLVLYPGLAILLTTLPFYLLGHVLEAEFVAGGKEPEVPVAIVDAAFR